MNTSDVSNRDEFVDDVNTFARLAALPCDGITLRAFSADLGDAFELHSGTFQVHSRAISAGLLLCECEWTGQGRFLHDIRRDIFMVLSELTGPVSYLAYSIQNRSLRFRLICAGPNDGGYSVHIQLTICGSKIERMIEAIAKLGTNKVT